MEVPLEESLKSIYDEGPTRSENTNTAPTETMTTAEEIIEPFNPLYVYIFIIVGSLILLPNHYQKCTCRCSQWTQCYNPRRYIKPSRGQVKQSCRKDGCQCGKDNSSYNIEKGDKNEAGPSSKRKVCVWLVLFQSLIIFRNLCAHRWLKQSKSGNGTTPEFKAYYEGLSKEQREVLVLDTTVALNLSPLILFPGIRQRGSTIGEQVYIFRFWLSSLISLLDDW